MSLDLQTHEPNAALFSASTFDLPDISGSTTTVRRPSQTSGPERVFRYRVVKRSVDVTLVVFLGIVLLPVLIAIAASVWLSSPGPVLFSHRRIRRHGENRCIVVARRLYSCLRGQFGVRVRDRTLGRRLCLRRHRISGGGGIWRSGLRQPFALRPEIPAVAFGGMIDAIVPMAALGRYVLRRGKAIIRGARRAVRQDCERGAREKADEDC